MDLPDPGIKPGSPALQVDTLPTELTGKLVLLEKTASDSSKSRDQEALKKMAAIFKNKEALCPVTDSR